MAMQVITKDAGSIIASTQLRLDPMPCDCAGGIAKNEVKNDKGEKTILWDRVSGREGYCKETHVTIVNTVTVRA